MAVLEHINIRPFFHTTQLPCKGEAGDLIVVSPLDASAAGPPPP